MFLLTSHDLSHARGELDDYNASQDDIVTSVDDGSLVRQLSISSLGVVAIISLVRHKAERRLHVNTPFGWTLLIFVGWTLISPLWAEDFSLSLKRVAAFAVLCVATAAIARSLTLRGVILWTLFSTVFFLLIGILAEVTFGAFRPLAVGYRFAGTQHPNNQGVNCGLLILSAVAAANLDWWGRALSWSVAGVGFGFLLLTGSRTSLAAVLLALFVYLATTWKRSAKAKMLCSLSIASCCLVLLLSPATGLTNSLMLGREDTGSIDSFSGRTMIWQDVGNYIRQRPIIGFGYGGFWTPAHIGVISAEENWGTPDGHSTYLDYLLSLGAVGLICYTVLLAAGIFRAFHLYKLLRDSTLAFCGALLVLCAVDGLLESSISEGSFLAFILMVVLTRLALSPNPIVFDYGLHQRIV